MLFCGILSLLVFTKQAYAEPDVKLEVTVTYVDKHQSVFKPAHFHWSCHETSFKQAVGLVPYQREYYTAKELIFDRARAEFEKITRLNRKLPLHHIERISFSYRVQNVRHDYGDQTIKLKLERQSIVQMRSKEKIDVSDTRLLVNSPLNILWSSLKMEGEPGSLQIYREKLDGMVASENGPYINIFDREVAVVTETANAGAKWSTMQRAQEEKKIRARLTAYPDLIKEITFSIPPVDLGAGSKSQNGEVGVQKDDKKAGLK